MFSWYYIQINRGYLLMLFILYKTHNIDPWQAVQSLPGKKPKNPEPEIQLQPRHSLSLRHSHTHESILNVDKCPNLVRLEKAQKRPVVKIKK